MARPPKKDRYPAEERWKEKIRISKIIGILDQAACGEIEMSQSALASAKLLLSKVVPDLARQEHTGKDGGAIEIIGTVKYKGIDD